MQTVRLKKYICEWEKYIAFLQAVTEELQCTMALAEQIIFSVSGREGVKAFFPVTYFCTNYREQVSFPTQWQQAVEAYASQAPQGLTEALNSFQQLFGMYQAEVQLSSLTALQQAAKRQLKQAEEFYTTYGKLYSTLGILSGLGAAILLL